MRAPGDIREDALTHAARGGTGHIYQRVHPLGTGSMGETWLGIRVDPDGIEWRVCLKYIRPDKRANPELEDELKSLFVREARTAAALRHSNIVQLIDYDAEQFCLVYELVEGGDLRTLLNHSPRRRFSADQAVAIAIELCKALRRAHENTRRGQLASVIHRDLSPANVLFSYDGNVKLIDFGVSCVVAAGEPPTENVRGKLEYMSPEQTEAAELDGRSDLFSLGVLLFEMLSGVRPFDGKSAPDTVRRIHCGLRPALRDLEPTVPTELANVVDRLLMPQPSDRFASANACMDALSRLAPPATTLRDLGDFLGAIRPRKTITTTTIPEHQRRALALETTARIEPAGLTEQTLPYPKNSLFRQTLGIGGRAARLSRWRLGLSSAVAAAAAVGVGAIVLISARPAQVKQLKVDPVVEARSSESERGPTSGDPEVRVDVRDTSEGVSKPSGSSVAPERDSPSPVATHVASAMLRVGVVPPSRVWIDGEFRDWSPVTATLPPGRHTVVVGTAGGRRREIDLKAGEVQKLIIRLD